MSDLVVSLVLGSPEIEEQFAVGSAADVVVGNGGATSVAVRAGDDSVLDAVGVREVGLEVEVDVGRGAGYGQHVVRKRVGSRSTLFGAEVNRGGSREGNRGEEQRGESGEAHPVRCRVEMDC